MSKKTPDNPDHFTRSVPADYEKILTRMREQQRTLRDVCKDPDVPSINSWLRFLKKHPEMVEKHRRALYTPPYDVQIRRGVYSPLRSME